MSKALYNFYFLLAFLCVIGTRADAQDQKIGYVNTDVILNEIPEYKGIEQQIRVIGEQWRAELEQMEQEIDTLREEFEAKEILYTDEIRQEKQLQIKQKQQARQQYVEQKFGPEGDYFKKQQELLEPIQRNIYEAVTVVANRGDFDFVFDRAKNSSMLFSQKQWNLNEEVLQELGVSLNQ